MSAKRKDKKGRVLRTGESQRKDLTYQYRYQDGTGKRCTVYAPTLEELRAKEEEINKGRMPVWTTTQAISLYWNCWNAISA